MASRKAQKEQARAVRLAQQQAAASRAQRNRRLQIFGGLTALAAIVVVVAIVVSSGGSNTGPVTSAQARADYATVHSLLAGIPQHGTELGNPKAPVTLTYYGDLECPFCRAFTVTPGYFPEFITKQVRTGRVKVQYKSFCTATCNDHSQSVFDEQQVAAYAAGKQNLFWDYAELFYHEQEDELLSYVNSTWLTNLARQIPPLNIARWQAAQRDKTLLRQVTDDGNAGLAAGVTSTPTIVLSGPKGTETATGAGGGIPDYGNLMTTLRAVS